ncbi:MAG: histidine phosphatase family protein [Oleiphilaceae bacterium]|nr:histidine phosphatase family protein [Oleiphilaceae bacterium]
MASEPRTTWFDLIRHGEPEGGPMFRGSKDDPLSALGWEQMRAAIHKGEPWDCVLTSPLVRCRQFAQTLARDREIPLHTDARLREIGFGAWEGLTADIIQAEYGQERLAAFWADADNNPPPGGERFSDFQVRIHDAWEHWSDRLSGQRVLLVCHGGVIRTLLGHVMGIRPDRVLSAISVPYACRSRVRLDHSEYGTLSCLVSHGS